MEVLEEVNSVYCRTIDSARMVLVEYRQTPGGKELVDIDCNFYTCAYRSSCELAKNWTAQLHK